MNKEQLKIALIEAPFRTVLKATIAFYIAQAIVTFVGLAIFVAVCGTVAYLFF